MPWLVRTLRPAVVVSALAACTGGAPTIACDATTDRSWDASPSDDATPDASSPDTSVDDVPSPDAFVPDDAPSDTPVDSPSDAPRPPGANGDDGPCSLDPCGGD